ncbi:hypothetical protein F4778DRAFT_772024 [Xylariomycetidae sp. FL2044]|nr:hypothetical protein F4778DRAFT_772024 [Xylariomycetidae sp. FL2044]
MTSVLARLKRAVVAAPFLIITYVCIQAMNFKVMEANCMSIVAAGKIEWDGGSFPIVWDFFRVDFLNDLWRGATAAFAPASFGIDKVSSWQMFSFLNDLGPIYAIMIYESCRGASAYRPVYFPTIFTFMAQLAGIGVMGPIYYFLHHVFGPTASDLAMSLSKDREVKREGIAPLLPIVLFFHTYYVFNMYLAPDLNTRHLATWAWQMAPVWIGVANVVIARLTKSTSLKSNALASPTLQLAALSLVSAGVWVYTLIDCPYPLSTLFIPDTVAQTDHLPVERRAMQFDELCIFASSFLWLIYCYMDLRSAGLMKSDFFWVVALLPLITLLAGPGAAFAFGWYGRDRVLSSAGKGGSKSN